jgi:hypothetical protein
MQLNYGKISAVTRASRLRLTTIHKGNALLRAHWNYLSMK